MKRIDIPDFFDKKIMEGFHGRNYIASMQEIIMRNVTKKSFLEIFLMNPNIQVPINIESYYEDIFKKFKQTEDIRLLTNCNIDFNKKDGVESDFYKARILELLKGIERLDLMSRLPVDWNKGDDDNPNKYKDFILEQAKKEGIKWLYMFFRFNLDPSLNSHIVCNIDWTQGIAQSGKSFLEEIKDLWDTADLKENNRFEYSALWEMINKSIKSPDNHEGITFEELLAIQKRFASNRRIINSEKTTHEKVRMAIERAKSTNSLDPIMDVDYDFNIDWSKVNDDLKKELRELVIKMIILPDKYIDSNDNQYNNMQEYDRLVFDQNGFDQYGYDQDSLEPYGYNPDGYKADDVEALNIKFLTYIKYYLWTTDEINSDEFKKMILESARLYKNSRMLGVFGIDWNIKDGTESDYYKEEILKLFSQKDFEVFPENIKNLIIDWNRKDKVPSAYYKLRIMELVAYKFLDDDKVESILSSQVIKSDTQEMIQMLEAFNIDWNMGDEKEREELILLYLNLLSLSDYNLFIKLQQIQEDYNPLNIMELYKKLFFASVPFWKNMEDETQKSPNSGTISQETSKRVFLKSLLKGLYEIGALQILSKHENAEYRNIDSKGVFPEQIYPEGEELLDTSFIDRLSPIQLNLYLAFYINKLTKLNEITIFRRALGDFVYCSDWDVEIEKHGGKALTPEQEDYLLKRKKAEKKAKALIEAFYDMKREYDAVFNGEDGNGLDSKIDFVPMGSFKEFLEDYWKDESDLNSETTNVKMTEFLRKFKDTIDMLQKKGYFVSDIKKTFIYASKATVFQQSLYKLKVQLIQQLITYAKNPNNKDKIKIYYALNENKNPNSTNNHQSIIYFGVPEFPLPISMHIEDIELFDEYEKGATKIKAGTIIDSFCNKRSVHLLHPVSKEYPPEMLPFDKALMGIPIDDLMPSPNCEISKKGWIIFRHSMQEWDQYRDYRFCKDGRCIIPRKEAELREKIGKLLKKNQFGNKEILNGIIKILEYYPISAPNVSDANGELATEIYKLSAEKAHRSGVTTLVSSKKGDRYIRNPFKLRDCKRMIANNSEERFILQKMMDMYESGIISLSMFKNALMAIQTRIDKGVIRNSASNQNPLCNLANIRDANGKNIDVPLYAFINQMVDAYVDLVLIKEAQKAQATNQTETSSLTPTPPTRTLPILPVLNTKQVDEAKRRMSSDAQQQVKSDQPTQ